MENTPKKAPFQCERYCFWSFVLTVVIFSALFLLGLPHPVVKWLEANGFHVAERDSYSMWLLVLLLSITVLLAICSLWSRLNELSKRVRVWTLVEWSWYIILVIALYKAPATEGPVIWNLIITGSTTVILFSGSLLTWLFEDKKVGSQKFLIHLVGISIYGLSFFLGFLL